MDKKRSRHRNQSLSSDDEESSRHKRHKKHKERHVHHPQCNADDRKRQKHSKPIKGERDHRKRHDQYQDVKYDPNILIKQERDVEIFEEQQRERSHHDSRRRDMHRERERQTGDFGLNTESQPISDGNIRVKEEQPKERPNFETSGKLTEDTNTYRGVVIKYNEPPEAMIPKRKWRLYPFKGDTSLPILHIHRQSAYLLGRDRKIADIPVDHPSCSKQQAVLQFRAVNFTRPNGTTGRRVRPFIIDLESSNGTYLNSDKIEARRYYELKEKDVIKFGFSSREYVVLHDGVDTSEVDDGENLD